MNILVVSQYFFPEQFRINDIVTELVRRGHFVSVLTGLPNYPTGEIYDGYKNCSNEVDSYNGAVIYRCKLRPRYQGTMNLILNYLSFVIQAKKMLKRLKGHFDLIYVYGVSPVTQALPAIKFKKTHKKPIIYYVCDLWPECVRGEQNGHRQIGIRNPIYVFTKILTKYIYKRVDLILNKCDEFEKYNIEICKVKKEKQATLFEHAETIYLNVQEKQEDNKIVDFFFLGNIGRAQNCNLIIEATKNLKDTNNYKIHFVGDGSELKSVKDLVDMYELANKVEFHGKVSVADVIKYYNIADVCLLLLSHRTETGLTLPAKLTSYMAACRPIIASADGATKTIIEDANCGWVCPADNVDELTKLMQKVIDNPESLNGLGQNGREYFLEHFTLEKHVDELEKDIEKMVNI